MIKLGVTGGIGSGKTTVAQLLEVMGVPVYIADEESKRLTDQDPLIRQQLIALFGTSIYNERGLNRPLLASHIFSDKALLKQVNGIIHPIVKQDFLRWAAEQPTACCAIETAILFESGFDGIVDKSVMVYAPSALRIQRVMQRNGVEREEVERRMQSQMSDEAKRDLADYVLYNDDSRALIPQLIALLSEIMPLPLCEP